MTWEHRSELRADPARAPGERNIEVVAKRRSIWPSIAVAAAATAFGGVIWFAYQNGRDANHGGPPLIKAESGPVKVKPANPGGQEIPFQDSTVYDRLTRNGQKPVMEKLLPPPEAPVDRPPSAPPSSAPPSLAPLSADASGDLPPPPSRSAAISDTGSPVALAPAPGAIITAPQPVKVLPPVKASPRPRPEAGPDPIAALIAGQPSAAAPNPNAGGAYRIRLSAVRSPDSVAPEWARLKRLYPELGSLRNSFSKIEQPGKGVFYRVEAGPLDAAAAKSSCDRLRNQGLGCIVVKP